MESAGKVSARQWRVLAGCSLLYLATDADGPNFNAALPTIQDSFDASAGQIQWLTSVAGLMVAALVLLSGALGDLHGRKRVFVLGGLGLIASLVLQALSPSMGFLTVMRGLDGVFSSITTPLAIAIITMEFTGRYRAMALGVFTGVVALGESFLPILSGWLSESVGWRATFVIAITAATLAVVLVRRSAVESKNASAQKLDRVGVILNALLMVSFVGSFLLAGSRGFSDPSFFLALGAAVVFFLLFVWWERRVDQPALELSLFQDPAFLSAFLAGFCVFFVYVPLNPLLQFYFQNVEGYSAIAASAILIPLALGTAVAAPFVGKLSERRGTRGATLIGLCTMLVGVLALATLGYSPSLWVVIVAMALIAVGYGLANPPRTDALMSAAPDDVAGAASSANSMGTEGGSAAGIALGSTLALAFSARSLIQLGADAGMSPDEIQAAEETIRTALDDASTSVPGVSEADLQALFEGARTAASTGMGQTMLFMAVVVVVGIVAVWFGMGKQATPAQPVASADASGTDAEG